MALVSVLSASAQKNTTVEFHQAQARQVEPLIQTFILPKVAEMKVEPNRISFTTFISNEEVVAMKGEIYELKAYALANACKANNADVIIAATYIIDTDKSNKGYNVTVVGYPAVYEKWRDVQQGDYQWIQSVYGTDLNLDKNKKATESIK